MRMHSNGQGGQQAYLNSLNNTLDSGELRPSKHAQVPPAQTRRLMETTNMFNVYRNSLKNNQNNNSNGFENEAFSGQQTFSEPQSKQGSMAPQQLFSTVRQGGFYH